MTSYNDLKSHLVDLTRKHRNQATMLRELCRELEEERRISAKWRSAYLELSGRPSPTVLDDIVGLDGEPLTQDEIDEATRL